MATPNNRIRTRPKIEERYYLNAIRLLQPLGRPDDGAGAVRYLASPPINLHSLC